MALTHAEKKRKQRERDRIAGWREITIRVGQEHVDAVREFVASLSPPAPPTDPRQLDLLDQIDLEIMSDDDEQPGLF